jgi:hypothetical protein
MAIAITLVAGWFAFEAVRAACTRQDENEQTATQGAFARSLPRLGFRVWAR